MIMKRGTTKAQTIGYCFRLMQSGMKIEQTLQITLSHRDEDERKLLYQSQVFLHTFFNIEVESYQFGFWSDMFL